MASGHSSVVLSYPDQAEPHYHMMPYLPINSGKHDFDSQTLVFSKSRKGVYDENRKRKLYARVHQWLSGVVDKIESPVVITIAPGSEKNLNPDGFMYDIVDEMKHLLRMTLYRKKTVQKSTEIIGARSKARHAGTIAIKPPEEQLPPDFYQDKVVLILDDVWTSGSTLCACKDVVKKVSPMKIVLCAIGRTVS